MWVPHVFGHDAITCAALIGSATERIELGTAVVPTYPRHPTAMAQQAITAGAVRRLVLSYRSGLICQSGSLTRAPYSSAEMDRLAY